MSENHRKTTILLLTALSSVIAALFFYLGQNPIVCMIPISVALFYAAKDSLNFRITANNFLSLLIFVLFVVDDTAQRPWSGKDTLTRFLGDVFFYSFGLNGFEVIYLTFLATLLVTRPLQKTIRDLREGLGYLLLITAPLFVLCILAGIRGYLDGGDPYIASYQMRFIYLMPVYGTIGFICLNDGNRLRNFLTAFSFAMIFKAHQGAFMRFFYYGHYNEQEYLITHYYSAFVPLAVCFYLLPTQIRNVK